MGWRLCFPSPMGMLKPKRFMRAHGCHRKLLRLLGGFTLQTRNTDSWEGWVWGAKHVWGMENLGQMVACNQWFQDVSESTDLILSGGAIRRLRPGDGVVNWQAGLATGSPN